MKQSISDIKRLFFIGIGGIGMSALARYFMQTGASVYGYDKTRTEITDALVDEGIPVLYEDLTGALPELDKAGTLIVYTPAIPQGNKIYSHFRNLEFDMVKRAYLLGIVTRDTTCLAVAGTHGKTTTSAILGHLLAASGMPVTAFMGGIAENYDSNFISKGTAITVVEADEFDRSFLQLRPDIACVTSMDADHLDIYGKTETLEKAFHDFAGLVASEEKLLIRKGLPLRGCTVAIEEEADYKARNINIRDGRYHFDLKTPFGMIQNLEFLLPGHHNLLNATMAVGMALLSGAREDDIREALKSFTGVQRRFSYRIKQEDMVLIDDYAHHPTELEALYQAVSEMYPKDRKVIVFQPHLYSRTRDFADEFATQLAKFDEVLLLDIYPAREEPIEGITSDWLLQQVQQPHKDKISKPEIAPRLAASDCRIKLMVGAGDIGAEVKHIKNYLTHEH